MIGYWSKTLMKTFLFSLFALTLGLGSGWCQKESEKPADTGKADAGQAVDPLAVAISALEDSAAAYVDAFNKGDSKALADQFLPDGEMILLSGAAVRGREAIQEHYDEVFATGEKYTVSYESGAARLLTNGVAVEDAVMSFTAPSGEISVHPYTAVHVKQENGKWLLARVRDLSGDLAAPNEKLRALEWLIGDWVIQIDDADTWISFDWSKNGPYIDVQALTQEADIQSTAATMRIGWDARRGGFVSWSFDQLGGYNYSEWTSIDDHSYMLKTRGVTADGESLTSTQVIALAPSGESFKWSKRDQVIDGEVMPDRSLNVVKRPPAPKIKISKSKEK
jgi:uncharacterized protein (TIGR02246 family)